MSVPKPGGGCCTITVEYCVKLATTIEVQVGKIHIPSECGLPVSPSLMDRIGKKSIYRMTVRGDIDGTITPCPWTTGFAIHFGYGSCYQWTGTIPGTSTNTYSPCGPTECVKYCALCIAPGDPDPCTGEPQVHFANCTYSGLPCPSTTGPCQINTCTSP